MTAFCNRDITLQSPVVTICTTSLTFNNSTFCPHSVFMCFVWIWEQTAIIFLYNINWLVIATQSKCVHCAVRTARQAALLTVGRTFHELQRCSDPIARHLLSTSVIVLCVQPKDFCAPLSAHKPHSFPHSERNVYSQHSNNITTNPANHSLL